MENQDLSIKNVEAKRLHGTQTSPSKALEEANEQIKHELQGPKKQRSDLNFRSKSDDPDVNWFREQLISERVKVRRATVEKDQLKAELEELKKKYSHQEMIIASDAERAKAKKESGEEENLKAILEELKKKCSDQEFKMTSEASKVHMLEAQLLSQRAKVKRELVEKDQLNAELEELKKQRDEQNINLESGAIKVSHLEVQLNAEKAKVEIVLEKNVQLHTEVLGLKEHCSELKLKIKSDDCRVCQLDDQRNMESATEKRDLDESKAYDSSLSDLVSSLCEEKETLSTLLELSKNEVVAKSEVIRELQSTVKGLQKKVTIAMEREVVINVLRETLSRADQTGDANVTQARKDGYNDGLRDGRKIGWGEFVQWYERETTKPQMPTQGCAATQAGSSSQVM